MRPDWPLISSVAPEALIETTLELHWAVQLVASAGQTFAEPRPDDSHRAMQWAPSLRAFVGSPFAGPYPFRVAIRPDDLTLLLVDRTDGTLGSLPLAGKTLDEGHEWMSLGMATYLGGPPPRLERPEYDMPSHPVGAGEPFTGGDETARRVLGALYAGAADLISGAMAGRDRAPEIRCWPHHFDIAALLTIDSERNIGVGLAPMGGGFGGWYLYVTPRPYPDSEALPDLAGAGHWHIDRWTGAVLTGDEVRAMPPGERDAQVRAFLARGIDAASEALRRG